MNYNGNVKSYDLISDKLNGFKPSEQVISYGSKVNVKKRMSATVIDCGRHNTHKKEDDKIIYACSSLKDIKDKMLKIDDDQKINSSNLSVANTSEYSITREELINKINNGCTTINTISKPCKISEDDSSIQNDKAHEIYTCINILLGNYTFLNIIENGFYVFDNTHYILLSKNQAKSFIKKVLSYHSIKFKVFATYTEIYNQLLIEPSIQHDFHDIKSNENAIVFLNGTYYADTDTFEEGCFREEDYVFSIIKHVYDPNANTQNNYTRKFINSICSGDNALEEQLWEVIAYILSNISKAKVLFLLIGAPNSGKSTIISFIQNIIGHELCISLSPTDLSKEFRLAELRDKKLCVDADLSKRALKDNEISLLKKLSSGGKDQIAGNKKYGSIYYYINKCKFMYASNNMISFRSNEDLRPILNRLVILPFTNSIPYEEQDPDLIDKLIGEKNYCIQMCLDALQRLIKRDFHFVQLVNPIHYVDYDMEYDIVNDFIFECCEIGSNLTIKSSELYDKYNDYCLSIDPNFRPMNINQIIPFIKEKYGVWSISNGEFRSLKGITLKE